MLSDPLSGFQLPCGCSWRWQLWSSRQLNHGECHVHLQRVSGHVFDEVLVPGRNGYGVVPRLRAKLFLSANGGHSMLPFFRAVRDEP